MTFGDWDGIPDDGTKSSIVSEGGVCGWLMVSEVMMGGLTAGGMNEGGGYNYMKIKRLVR